MILSPFFRMAAFASILSALTTSLLIFLPEPEAVDFSAKLALHSNQLYLLKKWILLFHPMFAYLAMTALAVHFFKTKAHLVVPGMFFGLIWAMTEMVQQAYTIVALNNHWRPSYQAATDESVKNAIFSQLNGFYPVWDSMYFLIIFGFGIASILFGIALFSGNKLAKLLAVISILIGLFSILNFVSDYLQVTNLLPLVNLWYEWFYPYLQPLWRILLSLWLWKLAQWYCIKETSLT